MRKAGEKDLVKKILLIDKKMDKSTVKALYKCMEDLNYQQHTILMHLGNGTDYKQVAKILEVPVGHVKYKEKQAIRKLRAPQRFYRILLGDEEFEASKDLHNGITPVSLCGFTTKTTNILKRNGFYYIEELDNYISNIPERFAYIEGLGKLGMSEVLYYYKERGTST